MCAIVQHARVQWKWQPDRQHPLKTVLDGAVPTKDVRNGIHTVPFVLDHSGTVVVFRFVLLDSGLSIPNEFGGLRHVRVNK